jgi:hypothetical protein
LQFFQFSLSFSPSIVETNEAGAAPGGLLPADWFLTSPGAVDNTSGLVLGVSAFGSAVGGSGVLALLEFTASSPGFSPLTFSDVFLSLLDADFIENGGITVTEGTTVPEPATMILLAAGLALFGAGRLGRTFRRG